MERSIPKFEVIRGGKFQDRELEVAIDNLILTIAEFCIGFVEFRKKTRTTNVRTALSKSNLTLEKR